MTIVIAFKRMPGEQQVMAITVRLTSDDYVDALTRALQFASAFVTIPPEAITLRID